LLSVTRRSRRCKIAYATELLDDLASHDPAIVAILAHASANMTLTEECRDAQRKTDKHKTGRFRESGKTTGAPHGQPEISGGGDCPSCQQCALACHIGFTGR
jgi:hypothetical protein